MKCPYCNFENPEENDACEECERPLKNGDIVPQQKEDEEDWEEDGEKDWEDDESFQQELALNSVMCMACGARNSIERKICIKCSKILIKAFNPGSRKEINYKENVITIGSGDGASEIITPHLGVLIGSAMGVPEGRLAPEEFRKAIQTQRIRVDRALKKLPIIVKALRSNNTEEGNEIAHLFTSGLNLYDEALDKMEDYFDTKNIKDVSEGIEMAKIANDQVYRVKTMTDRKNR